MWQPIETAPRNQTFLAVLTCAGEQTICTMRWPVAEAKNSRPDNKTFHVERVTHWMPLPELPGAQPKLDEAGLWQTIVNSMITPTHIAQPTSSVPDTYAAGINSVAAMLQSKAAEYAKEHGHDDMGGLSFGSGMGGEIKMDYYTNLIELADDVRAMIAAAPEAKP